VFQYLVKKRLVDQFQWCLENFEPNLIDSESLIRSIFEEMQKVPMHQWDTNELDILHRLYKLEKDYSKAFEILLIMKSPLAFSFFESTLQGFDMEKNLLSKLVKLLQINAKKTV